MSEEIRNKLTQFESKPPLAVWNRIADALDQQDLNKLGQKLAAFESNPPADVWNSISNKLSGPRGVPFSKKYGRILRYAAVAAVLIIVASASTLFLNREETPSTAVQVVTPFSKLNDSTQEHEYTNPDPDIVIADQTIQPRYYDDRQMVQAAMRTIERVPELEPIAMLSIDDFTDDHIPEIACRNRSIYFSDPEERYMIYSSEDGHVARVPRRLFDAVACAEKDPVCTQNLKQVQEKFAASAMSADFTGVLHILNNLGENQ